MQRRILCVFPTVWDGRQLEACRAAWEDEVEVVATEPSDEDTPSELDVEAFIDRHVKEQRGRIHGVFSSSDYPGATVAAAIATELGLPGSRPERILRASHKYYSRLVQREAAPEAVPRFAALDPDDPRTWETDVGFPCFVKPVKGAFSVMVRRVEGAGALRAFLTGPEVALFRQDYVAIFNRLVRRYAGFEKDGGWFVAEGLVPGRQVTLEGWTARGGTGLFGVVDSSFHPGTHSFERFDYPSSLPEDVQRRMAAITLRVVERLDLRDTLFNVELTYDEATGRIGIIEVNPRMCGQFADLYQKVDGTSGYEVALAVASGRAPRVRHGAGPFGAAASFPLRVYEAVRVVRAPGPDDVRRLEAAHPGARVWLECRSGDRLADFTGNEDGESCRYAIANLGAASRAALDLELERVRAALGFVLEPVAAGRTR
jgi:ATP-grasp domain